MGPRAGRFGHRCFARGDDRLLDRPSPGLRGPSALASSPGPGLSLHGAGTRSRTPYPRCLPPEHPQPCSLLSAPLVRAAFRPEWLSPPCRSSLENKGFLAVLTVSKWYFPHTLPGSRPARPGPWLLLSTPRPPCKWQGEAISPDGVRQPESSASWGDGSLGTSPIVRPCIQPGGNP